MKINKMDKIANIVVTPEGVSILNINGFQYRTRRVIENKHYWRCRQTKSCKASAVTQFNKNRHIVISTTEHSHDINKFFLNSQKLNEV